MIQMIITILVFYLFYYLWIVFNFDKNGNLKERKKKSKKDKKTKESKKANDIKMPAEVEYFVLKYKIDLKKVNYRRFLQLIGFVVAIDLSIVVTVYDLIDMLWIKLIVSFITMIVIVLCSFHILGIIFKKKGLVKDE